MALSEETAKKINALRNGQKSATTSSVIGGLGQSFAVGVASAASVIGAKALIDDGLCKYCLETDKKVQEGKLTVEQASKKIKNREILTKVAKAGIYGLGIGVNCFISWNIGADLANKNKLYKDYTDRQIGKLIAIDKKTSNSSTNS